MQCTYIKENGIRCDAQAMKEAPFCFSHNPDTKEEKHLAVVRGGENSRRIDIRLPPMELRSPKDVILLVSDTINGVRSGELPPNVANTIGFLSGHLLKAMEISDIEVRLSALEVAIGGKK